MKYKAWHLPGAGRLRGGVILREKRWTEAPVNGGRNYNGPKVGEIVVAVKMPRTRNGTERPHEPLL